MGILLVLIPAIPHIVSGIEALFGRGNGATKKQAAMGVMGDLVNALNTPGGTTGANSQMMAYIDDLIEATVKYMNTSGTFPMQKL